jgi:UTP--glucose-1-phosphate uridylyltransferase
VQIETAMGAGIGVFPGAAALAVERSRFLPVKTTNDLLLVRSDVYHLGDDSRLERVAAAPLIDLDSGAYKLVDDFEQRFSAGVPSLREAESLTVRGDWTFGADVRVSGAAALDGSGRVPDGAVVGPDGVTT